MGGPRCDTEPDRQRAGQARPEDRVGWRLIGEVAGAHGLHGEVKVDLSHGPPEELAPGAMVRLTWKNRPAVEARVRGARRVTAGARRGMERRLLALEGVPDRKAADAYRGAWVWVASPAKGGGSPGPADLSEAIGLPAVDRTGQRLGEVTDVIRGPQDRLVIERGDGSRAEVPAVEPILVAVEPAAGRVVVDPPEGLLE